MVISRIDCFRILHIYIHDLISLSERERERERARERERERESNIFLKVVIFFGHLLKITKKKELKTTRKNLEQQSPQPIVSVEKLSTI